MWQNVDMAGIDAGGRDSAQPAGMLSEQRMDTGGVAAFCCPNNLLLLLTWRQNSKLAFLPSMTKKACLALFRAFIKTAPSLICESSTFCGRRAMGAAPEAHEEECDS